MRVGDTFFIPAGTIHAIGGGLSMCEIQQNSDITYRLYDYGRDRELHLDKAMLVSSTARCDAGAATLPVDCEYFHTEAVALDSSTVFRNYPSRDQMVIVLDGSGTIDGQSFTKGEALLVPAAADAFTVSPNSPVKLIRTWPV